MENKKIWSYENRMVSICMLCFGFTMFNRFAIANLATFIMPDLRMSNTDLGLVMSAFSLSWGVAGYLGSALSDVTASKKRILLICVVAFSICSFLTGAAVNLTMFIAVRFALGIFEGPVFPVAQAFVLAQSSPKRRGMNMGLVSTTSMGLISMLLGPIVLVALCRAFGWRMTLFLTLLPGLMVAFLAYRGLKEPEMLKVAGVAAKAEKPSFKDSLVVFKNRNVITAILFSSFIMCWNVTTLTFAPLYLVNVKGFSETGMSYIMAIIGVGAVIWGTLVPSLSDRIGRKPAVVVFSLLTVVSPLGLVLSPSAVIICLCVFVGWCGSGVFPVYQAAILGESIDSKYASTAMAGVQMVGELGGCVAGVAIAGKLADVYGLNAPLIYAACCMVVATLIGFAYYETAPAIMAGRATFRPSRGRDESPLHSDMHNS